ncbi:hypothetical protein GCM10028778_20690 [Barrientosiimonas marina]|uniref:Uncharacterized protein n=1 Tax=Lentibacillus kimchii TaxID=1542911 RepID=A0ABW2UYL4_9BACI
MEHAQDNVRPIDVTNDQQSSIDYSGNSNVDVDVNVDTTPIAYAMLCSLLATNQMSNSEFESAVSELDDLTMKDGKHHPIRSRNDLSQVKVKKQLRR